MLIFYHMIKTGGTTLSYILRNNYGANHVEIFPVKIVKKSETSKLNFCTTDDIEWFLKINKNISSMSGHYLHPYLKLPKIFQSVKSFTFLRNPINRYISLYNHAKRYGLFKNLSLSEFIDNPSTPNRSHNYQTIFISGKESLKKQWIF